DLELRVEQRTNELAALNDELETFTYSVAHDLKAPLRGIDGYSHLLLEDHADQLDDEGRMFLGNVRAGVKRMAQLIDDLLAYSRMERRSLKRARVNLASVLRGILAEHAAESDESQAHIDVDVSDMSVEADPDGLAQVLRNLVGNALKYSRDASPPQIRIVARAEGEWCHLSVHDNGIGFDMKFHDRIFEIFQRLQRAEDYSGTGVGLAIVRKAVHRMGGRVWAESAPGEGATFHVELPR
ncbi:MAG: ATP-binding protein, partial [Azoarcus sp.]|nr:ATP-binding protein [Azoarcus sp.]